MTVLSHTLYEPCRLCYVVNTLEASRLARIVGVLPVDNPHTAMRLDRFLPY